MISALGACQFLDNFQFATTNRQPILIETNPFKGKILTLNGPFVLGPQLAHQAYVALPASLAQPLNFQALYGLTQPSHIGLGMNNRNVNESPLTGAAVIGLGNPLLGFCAHATYAIGLTESNL